MARKFIDVDEAAKMLGVSSETLNEMRERQKLHGYRDGANWKFKPEDIEKLIAEREAAEQEGEFAELDEDPDSILLSEVELGQSGESTSSTIIGGKSSRKDAADSDIQLAQPKHDSDTQLAPPKPDSDIQLAQPKPDSDIQLAQPANESELQLEQPAHDSDIHLDSALSSDIQGGSDVLAGGSGVSPLFDELDTFDLEMDSAADSGISSNVNSGSSLDLGAEAATSDIALGSDALKLEGSGLAFEGAEELSLGEASGAGPSTGSGASAGTGSSTDLSDSKGVGSSIDLAGDEDGDLVLGGSSHGDLSRTGDSGISLLDPADSGLSLESAPLELGGSAVESLELGEEDMLSVDEPAAKSGAAGKSGAAAQPQTDDDFLLTPLEEAGIEESDSGSQVIALDSEVEFDEAGASSAARQPASALGGLMEEDLAAGLSAAGALSATALAPAAAPTPMAAGAGAAAGAMALPEAPFSLWNVMSLVMCTVVLMLGGMFVFDLLRNMWSWNGPYPTNSWLMDLVLSWFEK
jgi:excisionase family DNA binding protein